MNTIKCPKCNTDITEGAMFCAVCGSSVEQQQNNINLPKPKGNAKNTIIIILIITGIIIAAGITLGVYIADLNNPINTFSSAIQDGDYIKATRIYRDELRYGDSDKLLVAEQVVISRTEELESLFIGNEIAYSDASMHLHKLAEIGILSDTYFNTFITSIGELQDSRDAYDKAQMYIEQGDYEQVLAYLRKVIVRDDNYESAQQLIVSSTNNYRNQIFEQLPAFDADKAYTDAITLLNNALGIIPDDADILMKINDYEALIAAEEEITVSLLIAEAREIATNGDYDKAIAALRNGLVNYPRHDNISIAIDDIIAEHVKDILIHAETLAYDKKYSEAIALLQEKYPNNSEIKGRISEYTEYLPVYIKDVDYLAKTQGANDWDVNRNKDNLQNYYLNGGLLFDTYNPTPSITFYTNRLYSRFMGTIVIENDKRDVSRTVSRIRVYSNDKLVYTSPELTAGVLPITFDIDIVDAETVTIMCELFSGWSEWSFIGVVDAAFYKE